MMASLGGYSGGLLYGVYSVVSTLWWLLSGGYSGCLLCGVYSVVATLGVYSGCLLWVSTLGVDSVGATLWVYSVVARLGD